MKKIVDLKSLRSYIKENLDYSIFGVGVHAFNRLGLEGVIDDYRLLSLRYSFDTQIIAKDIETFSLEKGMGNKHLTGKRNSTTILTSPKTKFFIDQFEKKPAMVVYNTTEKMEDTCKKNGWRLVSTPSKFGKKKFEDKIKFRKILEEINIPVTPGEVCLFKQLDFERLSKKYGAPFVLQHPRKGGGKGTFFINNKTDWDKSIQEILAPSVLDGRAKDDFDTLEIIVAKFIVGPSPSVTACVTKYGILSTSMQLQILDIPELYNPKVGSGLFCGHDWSSAKFSEEVNNQAYEAVEKVGKYFQKSGYKGIFGLDFILDEKTHKLYLVEANPRLLGTFPTIEMTQALNNEPPILAFHLLEYLDMDYEIDVNEINRLMRQEKRGAHMLMHNLTSDYVENHNELQAGVYKLKDEGIQYLRPGYAMKHIKNEGEFVITEGVPYKHSAFRGHRRICRIITQSPVLGSYKKLNHWAHEIVAKTYQSFDIRPIKLYRLKKIFMPSKFQKA